MSEENKKLVRRWFKEVWDEGRLSAIPEMFHQSGLAWVSGSGFCSQQPRRVRKALQKLS
jgi:hypothetical protein